MRFRPRSPDFPPLLPLAYPFPWPSIAALKTLDRRVLVQSWNLLLREHFLDCGGTKSHLQTALFPTPHAAAANPACAVPPAPKMLSCDFFPPYGIARGQ